MPAAPHKILITGASGYLGGDLLARLTSTGGTGLIPSSGGGGGGGGGEAELLALVRTPEQAEAVSRLYGARPLRFDARDPAAAAAAVRDNAVTAVYWLIDAVPHDPAPAEAMVRALADVRRQTGRRTHFLHTTGAKLFSSHAGAPTDKPLPDTDPGLFEIQKAQKGAIPALYKGTQFNCNLIELAEAHGVRSYLFAPCIVYGKGEGFGNPISIQTKAIVKAAKAAQGVFKVDDGRPTWPVCHVADNSALYIEILRGILADNDDDDDNEGEKGGPPAPPHGKQGYYLASAGDVAWEDLYAAMARALQRRGVVGDDRVRLADAAALSAMAEGIGCPRELVALQMGGHLTARNGPSIGWKPQYAGDHILEAADEEVERILQSISSGA